MSTIHEPATLAFSEDEYGRRVASCRSAMRAAGLDALLVTGPENICYLSGFATPGYHVFQAMVLPAQDEPFMVLRSIEVDNMRLHSWVSETTVIADLDAPARSAARAIRDRLGDGRRVGYDDASPGLAPRELDTLRAELSTTEFAPAGGLVEQLRAIKSDEELELIATACAMADRALLAGVAALGTAATDSEVMGVVQATLSTQGSEFTGSPPYVVGNAASALAHATHAQRALGAGSALWLELSAATRRYHGGVGRTAFRGTPPVEVSEASVAVAGAIEAMIAAARDGVAAGEVDRAGRSLITDAGFGEAWRNRGAYSIGLSFPPGLGEGHIIDLKPGDPRVLRSGMTFHLIPILKLEGLCAVGMTETIVVGDDAGRSLNHVPLRLLTPEDGIAG